MGRGRSSSFNQDAKVFVESFFSVQTRAESEQEIVNFVFGEDYDNALKKELGALLREARTDNVVQSLQRFLDDKLSKMVRSRENFLPRQRLSAVITAMEAKLKGVSAQQASSAAQSSVAQPASQFLRVGDTPVRQRSLSTTLAPAPPFREANSIGPRAISLKVVQSSVGVAAIGSPQSALMARIGDLSATPSPSAAYLPINASQSHAAAPVILSHAAAAASSSHQPESVERGQPDLVEKKFFNSQELFGIINGFSDSDRGQITTKTTVGQLLERAKVKNFYLYTTTTTPETSLEGFIVDRMESIRRQQTVLRRLEQIDRYLHSTNEPSEIIERANDFYSEGAAEGAASIKKAVEGIRLLGMLDGGGSPTEEMSHPERQYKVFFEWQRELILSLIPEIIALAEIKELAPQLFTEVRQGQPVFGLSRAHSVSSLPGGGKGINFRPEVRELFVRLYLGHEPGKGGLDVSDDEIKEVLTHRGNKAQDSAGGSAVSATALQPLPQTGLTTSQSVVSTLKRTASAGSIASTGSAVLATAVPQLRTASHRRSQSVDADSIASTSAKQPKIYSNLLGRLGEKQGKEFLRLLRIKVRGGGGQSLRDDLVKIEQYINDIDASINQPKKSEEEPSGLRYQLHILYFLQYGVIIALDEHSRSLDDLVWTDSFEETKNAEIGARRNYDLYQRDFPTAQLAPVQPYDASRTSKARAALAAAALKNHLPNQVAAETQTESISTAVQSVGVGDDEVGAAASSAVSTSSASDASTSTDNPIEDEISRLLASLQSLTESLESISRAATSTTSSTVSSETVTRLYQKITDIQSRLSATSESQTVLISQLRATITDFNAAAQSFRTSVGDRIGDADARIERIAELVGTLASQLQASDEAHEARTAALAAAQERNQQQQEKTQKQVSDLAGLVADLKKIVEQQQGDLGGLRGLATGNQAQQAQQLETISGILVKFKDYITSFQTLSETVERLSLLTTEAATSAASAAASTDAVVGSAASATAAASDAAGAASRAADQASQAAASAAAATESVAVAAAAARLSAEGSREVWRTILQGREEYAAAITAQLDGFTQRLTEILTEFKTSLEVPRASEAAARVATQGSNFAVQKDVAAAASQTQVDFTIKLEEIADALATTKQQFLGELAKVQEEAAAVRAALEARLADQAAAIVAERERIAKIEAQVQKERDEHERRIADLTVKLDAAGTQYRTDLATDRAQLTAANAAQLTAIQAAHEAQLKILLEQKAAADAKLRKQEELLQQQKQALEESQKALEDNQQEQEKLRREQAEQIAALCAEHARVLEDLQTQNRAALQRQSEANQMASNSALTHVISEHTKQLQSLTAAHLQQTRELNGQHREGFGGIVSQMQQLSTAAERVGATQERLTQKMDAEVGVMQAMAQQITILTEAVTRLQVAQAAAQAAAAAAAQVPVPAPADAQVSAPAASAAQAAAPATADAAADAKAKQREATLARMQRLAASATSSAAAASSATQPPKSGNISDHERLFLALNKLQKEGNWARIQPADQELITRVLTQKLDPARQDLGIDAVATRMAREINSVRGFALVNENERGREIVMGGAVKARELVDSALRKSVPPSAIISHASATSAAGAFVTPPRR